MLLLFILLLAVCALHAQEQSAPVRVGATFSVPNAYLSPEGEPTGFLVEVFREAARRENLRVRMTIERTSPDAAVESGSVDIWAIAVPTTDRRRKFHLTAPWWSLSNYIAVRSQSAILSERDLAGKTVLFTTTPPFTVPLSQFLPGANSRPENNLLTRLEHLCSGKTDAILFYESTISAVLGSSSFDDCRARGIRIFPTQQPVMELSIMSSFAKRDLAERFRARIGEMQRQGVIERLPSFHLTGNEQWKLQMERERETHEGRLWQLGLAFTMVLLAGSVFAYMRLRAAHKEVRRSLEVAREANRVKGEFLATISHEIRTPMTAVLGYIHLLIGSGLRKDQAEFAREVAHATSALLTMLTDVLDYSRSLSGKNHLRNEPFDPVEVLDDSMAALLLQAESKRLELNAIIDPSVPSRLYGDGARLRHMIMNLLTNAVKFTPEGWVELRASYSREGIFSVTVADSGIGIPAEKQQLIFLPFTQVDSTHQRTQGGIGLGLAIVSDLCKQMGGTVSVRSAPREGSEFRIDIPLSQTTQDVGWIPKSPATVAVAFWEDGRHTRVIRDYLKAAGIEVRQATSLEGMDPLLESCEDAERPLCLIGRGHFDDAARKRMADWKKRYASAVYVFVCPIGTLDANAADELFDYVLTLPLGGRAFRELLQPAREPLSLEKVDVRLNVLVADDNAVNRRLLTALLERLGCSVDAAADGAEAVEKARNNSYSLILMDCQMPVVSGFDAARRIREANGSRVPIWGVSAALESEVRQQCLDSGMNDYLEKPIAIDRLHAMLQGLGSHDAVSDTR